MDTTDNRLKGWWWLLLFFLMLLLMLCDADVVFERGKINQEYYFYFLKRLVQQR
jgi:hypothetical protein